MLNKSTIKFGFQLSWTGFKLGALYGQLSAILIILLNLNYVESIRTLLSVFIYFSLGFGLGLAILFGILGFIAGIFIRNPFFESGKMNNKIFQTGIILIFIYSMFQYQMDLAEYRFSLLPLSIGFIRWISYLFVFYCLIRVGYFYYPWDTRGLSESKIKKLGTITSHYIFILILFIITALSINPSNSVHHQRIINQADIERESVAGERNPSQLGITSDTTQKESSPMNQNNSKTPPVIFIGWDGADWDVAQKLMNQGKLPNLQKLISSGASGKIRTFRPTLSPAVWTSISTGKKPIRTGILHFFRLGESPFFNESLGAVPMNRAVTGWEYFVLAPMNKFLRVAEYGLWRLMINDSNNRDTKAVWNIAGENGKKIAVVNMMVTTPVEKINGYMVTDYLQLRMKGSADVTYPPSLYDEIKSMEITEDKVTPEILRKIFNNLEMILRLSNADNPVDNVYWRVLKQAYAEDVSTARYAEYIYKTHNPDMIMLYFHGPDTICHHFWKYHKPDAFWGIPKKDIDDFGQIINLYYQMTDELLKPWVNELENGATIVLCSDHGFQSISPMAEKIQSFTGTYISGDHRYMPPGMVILAGPNIQKNIKIPDMNVLDITPTLLWFSGISIAEDMDGEVPVAAVTKDFALSHPPKFIQSYEQNGPRNKTGSGSEMSEQYRERLRSLGYIQ